MSANRIPEGDEWLRLRDGPDDRAPQPEGRHPGATHRSGQYPAMSAETGAPESALPEAPMPGVFAESPKPLDQDHPFRRPFASLIPGTRLEDFGAPPASTPPSLRRPLSAAPPRRLGNCPAHRIALSPNGECVLCRREEKPARGRGALAVLAVLSLAALAAWFFLL